MSVLLRLAGVRRAFGDLVAVDDLDLDVREGEVHALVGLNGAGKSTAMRVALGMLAPDRGTATVSTSSGPVAAWRAPADTWRGVGHLVEVPFAYPELTVTETVVAAARLRGLGRAEARAAAEEAVDALGLAPWARRRTGTLSQGNRQRLGLACASVHRPRLLVLDEPTTALDPAGVLLVRRWLRATRSAGAGVLVSSHHLDEVARIADRITVLHRGRVAGTLPPGGTDLERRLFAVVARADGLDPTDAPDALDALVEEVRP
ncbi:ABC transporter ATP-binding protein [Actinotalea sp. AC32]|nr:ABC transporter ATP-binding protein [Actinotalea sp. AC32]